jgi:hypothetical protein
MKIFSSAFVLSVVLMVTPAWADTYKCRMPDGKIAYMGQLSMVKGAKCEAMFVRKPSAEPQSAPAQPASAGTGATPGQSAATGQPQPPAPLKQAPPSPVNGTAAAPQAPSPKSPEDQALEAKRKQQEAADAQKKADQDKQNKLAEQKVKDENCQKARANLQMYQIGGRIARVNEQGEKVYLDDNDIAQKLDAARQDVAKWCEG